MLALAVLELWLAETAEPKLIRYLTGVLEIGTALGLLVPRVCGIAALALAGIMGGAYFSGRLAGRIKPQHQIRHGFLIMLLVSIVNLVLNLLFTPQAWWALIPLGIYAFG